MVTDQGTVFQRDVLAYLACRMLWMAAAQMIDVAVGWTIYDVTHSALALGFVGLAAFTPRLLLTLVSGIVADHYDRRRILAVGFSGNAVVSAFLMLVVLQSKVNAGPIYLLYILFGTVRGFVTPAAQAMVANLVPRAQFSRVVSMTSSTGQVARIAGPALGGLLYVAGNWVPFAVAAAFYMAAAGLILSLRIRERAAAKAPPKLADAFAGLVFIWQRPVILGAISLDLFSVLLGGATALLPIIVQDLLHGGPFLLGLLRATPALGAMMLGAALSFVPLARGVGVKLFVAIAVFGLSTIGLGLSHEVWLSLVCLWLIGASDVFSVVIRQTLVQADTPDQMRGRVAAVNTLFVGASNELGEFESGVTAALFGLVPAIIIGGAGTILVAALWAAMFPKLRRRDHLFEP